MSVRGCLTGCLGVIGFIVLIAVVGRLTFPIWMSAIGRALDVSPDLQPSDVIVALGGGNGDREVYAARLYRQGLAPRVLVTGGPKNNAVLIDELARMGVRRDAIELPGGSNTTREDAIKTRQIMEKNGWKSILLVSDPYHMRRSVLTFETVFSGTGIRIRPAPVVGGTFSDDRWWENTDSFVAVFDEYVKLLYYVGRGYIAVPLPSFTG